MTDTDDHVDDLDHLFALLGRAEHARDQAQRALDRSERVRARMEKAADARNTERNEMIEALRDLGARCATLEAMNAMHDGQYTLHQQDQDALTTRLAKAHAEVNQLRAELGDMTAARDKAIAQRDGAILASKGAP